MGLRGSETVSRIAAAVVGGDEAGVLRLTGEAFDAGIDPLDLVGALTEWIRYLLVFSIDPETRELQGLTDETRKVIAGQAAEINTRHLLTLLSMIADAEDRIKRAGHQRYLLESVVLRMANVKSIARISDIIDMLEKGGGGEARAKPSRRKAGPAANTDRSKQESAPAYSRPVKGPVTSDLVSSWQDVIESLRETKMSLASILDLCEPPEFSQGVYWLQLPSAFHESQVLKGQNLRILTEEVRKLTNNTVTIKTKVKPEERIESSDADDDIASIMDNDPLIRSLAESLGGKVVGIRRRKDTAGGQSAN
jgi:DNA polymerase III gamma/tau subunit